MQIIRKFTGKINTLKNHTGAMKYLKNTSWLFAEKILRMTLGLFVGIWVARYLGPEQFGLFSYAQSFVALFTAFATLGLDGIVIRELIKDESQRDKLLGTAFTLKLMGGIAVLLFLAIAMFFQSSDSLTTILIFIIASATIFQSFNVIDFYFQSKVLSKYVVYSNVLSLLISSIIKVVLILNEAPLIDFAWVVLFDSFILAIGFIYFYLKNELSFRMWRFNKEQAVTLLKDSWPLILSGVVVTVYMKIDQIMIKEILSNEAVGQYAAATRLSETWYFIPVVISASLFPAILNAKQQSEMLYYSRLQKLYTLMVWLAIAIALPMTFLSDWVINLLYGDAYNQAGNVLMIHIWSGVFVFFGCAWAKWMLAESFQLTIMKMQILSLITNVILNSILIPLYGIEGAAVATFLSYSLGHTVFALFFSNQKRAVKMFWGVFLYWRKEN
jgi:O-antigen/teichoic acid export membrane protein